MGNNDCNEENNIEKCEFDGGDCTEPVECPWPDWIDDKVCDEINNIASCDYDGGDCCAPFESDWQCTNNAYSTCECLDPGKKLNALMST
jgi:hypothetical protein